MQNGDLSLGDVQRSNHERKARGAYEESDVRCRLRDAHSAEDVWSIIQMYKSNNETALLSRYCAKFMRKLLSLEVDFQDLFTLLLDPVLNPLKADHLRIVMARLEERTKSIDDYRRVLAFVEQCMTLGVVNDEELKNIFLGLRYITEKLFRAPLARRAALFSALQICWKALKSSQRMPRKDLKDSQLRFLLGQATIACCPQELACFVTDITQSVPESQLGPVSGALSAAFSTWIEKMATMEQDVNLNNATGLSVSWMVDIFNSLPGDVARSLITSTTDTLRTRSAKMAGLPMIPKKRVEFWMATVAQCNHISIFKPVSAEWKAISRLLGDKWSLHRVAPYLSTLSNVDVSRYFLSHLPGRFLRDSISDMEISENTRSRVYAHYEQMCAERPGEGSFRKIIQTCVQCNVKYDDVLRLLLGLLRRLSRPYEIFEILRWMIMAGHRIVRVVMQQALCDLAKFNGQLTLILLRLQIQYTRQWFCPYSSKQPLELVIRGGLVHPEEILDLLHLAAAPRDQSKSWTNLVNVVATQFAFADHLSSRAAYRHVGGCYLVLRRHGGPVDPLMTRALTHAAVTRPLKEGKWVSSALLDYILRLVSRVEGDHVACSLAETVHEWQAKNFQPLTRWDDEW